jgi:RHS repeat-associated protein
MVYDIMGHVIAEYQNSGTNYDWKRSYVYGATGELVSLHLPRTSAMNTAFDNLVSFAEAWLCDPNCPAALLAWDTTDDDYIDYYDYVDNTVYFEGAFSSNIYYCLTDKDNSVVGVVDAYGDIEYIAYNAWGTPNYTGDIQGLSILWNGYYYDGETGNYYLKNRYYSPIERQFLTEDPHGIVPDEKWNNPWDITNQYSDGVGLTVYAGFNPVNGRDDWGLKGCCNWLQKLLCDWKEVSFTVEFYSYWSMGVPFGVGDNLAAVYKHGRARDKCYWGSKVCKDRFIPYDMRFVEFQHVYTTFNPSVLIFYVEGNNNEEETI